jgi:SAM-dependent methyltransferase
VSGKAGKTRTDKARQTSRRLGETYDQLPYFRPGDEADPALDMARILGLSRLYGGGGAARWILDLGCGSGALLDRAGQYAPMAELVGVDISRVACVEARRRLAPHGPRAEIRHADLLDLDIASLGAFDVIFAVGFAFCVPDAVTERLYQIIGEALAPGGVAVIGHYAGVRAALSQLLFATIRDALPPDLSPAEAIVGGRGIAWAVGEALAAQPSAGVMAELLQQALQREDEPFYTEVLNPHWRPIRTGEIAGKLEAAKISFACALSQVRADRTATERVMGTDMADLADFANGGHRYSLFTRNTGRSEAPDPWREGLVWRAPLARDATIAHRYVNPQTGVWCDAGSPETRALLDATADQPRALEAIPGLRGMSSESRQVLRNDLLILIAAGLVQPSVAG